MVVAVLFSLQQPLCSSHARALGECQPLLLTLLFVQTDPTRRAATGCECPGSVRVLVILHRLHISILIRTAQAFLSSWVGALYSCVRTAERCWCVLLKQNRTLNIM